ncbi:TetR/AcrR family transcriptional regulator [Oceanobacillus saliphilus]|uniref:TetR/AcrR family transcriptional regulator n=1 Tax=Oceanobacillus saliphilus TaxID=2925834 RepID=UPI00201E3D8D
MSETSEKILQAALDLMQAKGFDSVTTKEIAEEAGVSEMTIYRHFRTKKGVLEAAINKYSYVPCFQHLFEEKINWNIEQDLELFSTSYLELMKRNKPIFLISIHERTTMPEIYELISKNTLELKSYLSTYLANMHEKGLIQIQDAEMQATVYLTTLYGYFSSIATWENHFLFDQKDIFIKTLIQSFCNGVRI